MDSVENTLMVTYLKARYFFDRVCSLLLLILLLPILLVAIILVKLDGGPAFFKQQRIGLNEKAFDILKLRTMIVDADQYLDENGMPTRKRTTQTGDFLRKYSIDEIPQLINIVMGDMAIIGPRPILPAMLPYMTAFERARFLAKPGVSGLAQIKGRNNIKWSKRFRYDIFYGKHAGLCLDLHIILKTLIIALKGSDIAPDINRDKVDDIRTRELTENG